MPIPTHDTPPAGDEIRSLWFVFDDGKLLIKQDANGPRLPDAQELAALGFSPQRQYALGAEGKQACYAAEWDSDVVVGAGFDFATVRSLFGVLEDGIVLTAGLGGQLIQWNRAHRFCGRCGGKTEDKPDERAKICPGCGLLNYPRLSPAVIVAVIKDDRILLARNKRFKRAFYSVLAGFVEPGETLEQCVEREIFEEAGISVTNIRYYGSQPWPFPDSLMVGFTADYAGGDIRADGLEITDAGWFSRDNLPPVPPKLSIARQLIDWFVDRHTTR